MEAFAPTPGLRERKKQKTRETIISVALELFAARGYEQTTIAEIAEAAEVSPRTIFAYFPSKEDILFCDVPEFQERLAQALRQRPDGVTTLDTLREVIAGSFSLDPSKLLRARVVASDERLLGRERAHMGGLEELIVESIARDLNAGPDDIRPRIVAASLIAAFRELRNRDPVALASSSPEDGMELLDDVLGFLRGGLDALRHESGASAPISGPVREPH
jgi:AcrR family transcriptional regulator